MDVIDLLPVASVAHGAGSALELPGNLGGFAVDPATVQMEIDYVNLLGLTLIAVGAPLLMDILRLPVPDAVAMILLGIGFGGSGLGWIELDDAAELLSALGLAYLLFVAGLEIRLDLLRGRMLAAGVGSFVLSCGVAVGAGAALYAADLVDDVGVVVAALLTTSVGIVVVVLKDADRLRSPVGQLTLLGALLGDVASVALLSVLFVGPGGSSQVSCAGCCSSLGWCDVGAGRAARQHHRRAA